MKIRELSVPKLKKREAKLGVKYLNLKFLAQLVGRLINAKNGWILNF